MAIEFYETNDQKMKNVLFSLDNNDFEYLQNTLSRFEKLTGLVIDEYGKTRITYEHIKLISNLLDFQIKDDYNITTKSRERLLVISKLLKDVKNDLIAVGD